MITITVDRKEIIDAITKELGKINDEHLAEVAEFILISARIVDKGNSQFEYIRYDV
jgi:hypothetical protein